MVYEGFREVDMKITKMYSYLKHKSAKSTPSATPSASASPLVEVLIDEEDSKYISVSTNLRSLF